MDATAVGIDEYGIIWRGILSSWYRGLGNERLKLTLIALTQRRAERLKRAHQPQLQGWAAAQQAG